MQDRSLERISARLEAAIFTPIIRRKDFAVLGVTPILPAISLVLNPRTQSPSASVSRGVSLNIFPNEMM
jgi:hypothetical protein